MKEYYQEQVATLEESLQKTEQELYAAAEKTSELEHSTSQTKQMGEEISKYQEEVCFVFSRHSLILNRYALYE
jgi:hypothetical protein